MTITILHAAKDTGMTLSHNSSGKKKMPPRVSNTVTRNTATHPYEPRGNRRAVFIAFAYDQAQPRRS
jgi:hypothetical protein